MINTGLYGMRITRILYDESETPESIARRIVRAFNPGEIFCIQGKYFKVSIMRTANETVQDNVVDNKYTLVLNVGESEPVQALVPPVVVAPEPVVEVPPEPEKESEGNQPEPTQARISEPPPSAIMTTQSIPQKSNRGSGKYRIERTDAAKVTREGPPKVLPVAGQMWQTKDSRRINSPPFVVTSVDSEFAYTDKGARISLKRWRNYRLVERSTFEAKSG
jgi:hypothetical protein